MRGAVASKTGHGDPICEGQLAGQLGNGGMERLAPLRDPQFAEVVPRFFPVARPTSAECCEFLCGIEAALPCLASDDDDAVDA